jgi:hypothetical protein
MIFRWISWKMIDDRKAKLSKHRINVQQLIKGAQEILNVLNINQHNFLVICNSSIGKFKTV